MIYSRVKQYFVFLGKRYCWTRESSGKPDPLSALMITGTSDNGPRMSKSWHQLAKAFSQHLCGMTSHKAVTVSQVKYCLLLVSRAVSAPGVAFLWKILAWVCTYLIEYLINYLFSKWIKKNWSRPKVYFVIALDSAPMTSLTERIRLKVAASMFPKMFISGLLRIWNVTAQWWFSRGEISL